MFLLFYLLARLPLRALHAIGAVLGWCVFAVSLSYRRRLKDHALLAGCTTAQWRAAVGHAGRMVAELPRLWMGSPVYIEQLAAPASATVPAVYGDPNGFVVRRTPVEVAVLNERYADTGHIGFRVSLRIDSKIADSAALRKFIQAAS